MIAKCELCHSLFDEGEFIAILIIRPGKHVRMCKRCNADDCDLAELIVRERSNTWIADRFLPDLPL